MSNHYTLVIESEEGEIYSSDTWDKSLIDRLELGMAVAEEEKPPVPHLVLSAV